MTQRSWGTDCDWLWFPRQLFPPWANTVDLKTVICYMVVVSFSNKHFSDTEQEPTEPFMYKLFYHSARLTLYPFPFHRYPGMLFRVHFRKGKKNKTQQSSGCNLHWPAPLSRVRGGNGLFSREYAISAGFINAQASVVTPCHMSITNKLL